MPHRVPQRARPPLQGAVREDLTAPMNEPGIDPRIHR